MFDIGFFELLLIGVVGLVVIGPEKLPTTIRTCALWLGRVKRSISEARQEVEKQIGADEIRRELHNEQVLRNLEKMREVHSDLKNKIQMLDNPPIEHEPADDHSEHHSHAHHNVTHDNAHSETHNKAHSVSYNQDHGDSHNEAHSDSHNQDRSDTQSEELHPKGSSQSAPIDEHSSKQ